MAKYQSVNGRWPEGTNEGRDIKPTPEEALTGFRRLFKKAMGRRYKGKLILTTGNRRTWYGSPQYGERSGTIRVNPDERGGGWHEIVHSVSHMASWSLHREAHGPRHAFIERTLIEHVVRSGWLEGKLRRPDKPKPDPRTVRQQRIAAGIKRWQAKAKRAETALRKLERQRKYYERQQAA